MKKCLPSIVSATLCPSLVMTPFVPVAAAHADEGSPAESSDIYVGVNYDENYDISLFWALRGFIFQGVVRFSRICK